MTDDLPPVSLIRQNDTHRLILSQYTANGESVLMRIADDEAHLHAIFELYRVTNDRLWAEHDLLPGITSHELVFGVPSCKIINAAFTHARPEDHGSIVLIAEHGTRPLR